MKQTTDTICSVTANPLRGGVAESVDMGSERMIETERKAAENGIGIFPWNRFWRMYCLVNAAPFQSVTDRWRIVADAPENQAGQRAAGAPGGPGAHIAAVIWASCVMGYGLRNLMVIACKLSENVGRALRAGRLAPT
ncbi:hypothetical protein [Burkholderia anthina]|uniref:hypothetical protein n=1 Tax=Burkholderia anthina TaxID=179879 RepID=UPI001588E53D|nr:hypothetical protein [Burkholderia anthina]